MGDVAGLDEVYAAPESIRIDERVIISPASGRFHPRPPESFTTEGEWVEEGQVLAEISSGSDSVPVISIFSGWMMGMLVIAGQPVSNGDKLFWIRP